MSENNIMKEDTLKSYFEGKVSVDVLAEEVASSIVNKGVIRQHHIKDMDEEYPVNSSCILKLCEEGIAENLTPEHLTIIAFCLRASDSFMWDSDTEDGEKVDEVIFNWESPEINYPATEQNLKLWKHYLLTGENKVGNQ